jgi:putative hemolysin
MKKGLTHSAPFYMNSHSLFLAMVAIICPMSLFAQSEYVPNIGMANPASVNCVENHHGYLRELVDPKTQAGYGVCVLSPTLAFEEWCLYRMDHHLENGCANQLDLTPEDLKSGSIPVLEIKQIIKD